MSLWHFYFFPLGDVYWVLFILIESILSRFPNAISKKSPLLLLNFWVYVCSTCSAQQRTLYPLEWESQVVVNCQTQVLVTQQHEDSSQPSIILWKALLNSPLCLFSKPIVPFLYAKWFYIYFLFIYRGAGTSAPGLSWVKGRGQLAGVSSLIPLCGSGERGSPDFTAAPYS